MRKNVMKKWVVIGLSCVFAVALAGCGTKTEATDQVSESNNVELETENVNEDAEEETKDINTSVGAEDENIVLYAEKGKQSYIGQKDKTFEAKNVSLIADTNIPLYDGDGYEVGYVKENGSITVTEGAVETTWDRFENPYVEGDYLYILREFVPDETAVIITPEMLKQEISDRILNIDEDTPTIIDAPDSDMDVYEFRMYSSYNNSNSYRSDIMYYYNNMGFMYSDYMTYAIETFEDDGDIICRIYYKDAYEDWIKNQ